MKRVQVFGKILAASVMVASVLTLSSCKSYPIFDGEGDCEAHYRIKFKYDYNIKFADAFANEVNSIALYVFDEDGVLVDVTATDNMESLTDGAMIYSGLKPGKYTIAAWGGLNDEESARAYGTDESFAFVQEPEIGVTQLEDMHVRMNRRHNIIDGSKVAVVDEDLQPLFHGTMPLEVTGEPGTYTQTMTLMKNTNSVRILLHDLSGDPIDPDKFIFEIKDDNGLYDWDNTLLPDEEITYEAWDKKAGTAEVDDTDVKAITSVSVALAEFTIGRMDAEDSPILYVRNKETGKDVLRIPVADYALLVRGNYKHQMSDQEYLDRQDEYTMTFFLDEGDWASSVIYINSWRVVLNDTELN